jgi:hypothetical protein
MHEVSCNRREEVANVRFSRYATKFSGDLKKETLNGEYNLGKPPDMKSGAV